MLVSANKIIYAVLGNKPVFRLLLYFHSLYTEFVIIGKTSNFPLFSGIRKQIKRPIRCAYTNRNYSFLVFFESSKNSIVSFAKCCDNLSLNCNVYLAMTHKS